MDIPMHSPIALVLLGFVLIHGFWYYCAILGVAWLEALEPHRAHPGFRNDAVELVISTTFGGALVIFALFLLGIAGFYRPVAIIVVLLSMLGASLYLATRFRGGTIISELLRRPFVPFQSWPILAVYAATLAFFIPSLLPPTMFDATMYHLAYAQVWANDGKLSVDPYIRFPMFTYNFELLFGMFFALHLGRFVDLLTWLMFVISVIGIFSLVDFVLVNLMVPKIIAICGGFMASLAFLLCPTVLKFCDVGYIDVPVGAFFLAATSAIIFASKNFRAYGFAAAAISASFIGMKIGLVLDIPLLVFLFILIGKKARAPQIEIVGILASFVIILAPWYLRSLYYTGDPLSPLLNGLLHKPDPFMSPGDFAAASSNNPVVASRLIQMFTTPFQLFAQSDANLNLAICLYPLLVVVVFYGIVRRRTDSMFLINLLNCVALYGMLADSLTTAMISRYALHFYPLFLCALFVSLFWGLQEVLSKIVLFRRVVVICAVALSFLLTQSVPGSSTPLRDLVPEIESFSSSVNAPTLYISQRVDGYHNAEDLSNVLLAAGVKVNVLAVHFENLAYYFRARHITSVGDWVGPGRFSDFRLAVNNGSLKSYLDRLDIGAVMLLDVTPAPSDSPLLPSEITAAEKALMEMGFANYSIVGDPVKEYVKRSILDRARASGYASTAPRVASADYSVVSHFDLNNVIPIAPASTPSGRGALVMRWPSSEGNIECLTVVSGFAYTVSGLRVGNDTHLLFSVAKPFSAGSAAVAYVDELADGKKTRIFQGDEKPADGDDLKWTAENVKILPSKHDIDLVFGASSLPGLGIADWIAFQGPVVSSE